MARQRIRRAAILVSFLLFPVTFYYLSPYLIIMGASERVVSGSFVAFLLMFLSSLFFGRAFCGWVCPAGGLLECCFMINDKEARGGKLNWIKYLIWVPWLSIIAITAISAGGFRTVEPLYQTEHGISILAAGAIFIYYIVIALAVVLSFFAGKRAFCHYVCWMAPFMIVGRRIRNIFKWPSLRLKADTDKCSNCKKCSRNCPMSLDVNGMVQRGFMENAECILCGTCVDVCPKEVIRYSFSSGQ